MGPLEGVARGYEGPRALKRGPRRTAAELQQLCMAAAAAAAVVVVVIVFGNRKGGPPRSSRTQSYPSLHCSSREALWGPLYGGPLWRALWGAL